MIKSCLESNVEPSEISGLADDEVKYLHRKVNEGDMVAINHFIRGLNYTRHNDVTLPKWREKALDRIRIRRVAKLLRGLADSLESWTELS